MPKKRAPESCNGLDDDCDGFTDNGASCGAGKVCALSRCVDAPNPDAGPTHTPDVGAAVGDDTGAPQPQVDAGGGTPFNGGGCGCGAAASGAPMAGLTVLALWLRRRASGR